MGILDFFNRGADALAGQTPNYGGLLTPEDQRAAQSQARMALAAQLLEAGGPSPTKTSFGQALGRSMLAAGQARQGSVDQSLQAALMRQQLAKAQQIQNRNHVIGNALVNDKGEVVYQGTPLDNTFGRINPGDYTPESLEKFAETNRFSDLKRVWAPPNPSVVQMAGGYQMVQGDRNGGAPRVTELSPAEVELNALRNKAGTEAQAKATGSVIGEAEGSVQKKAINAQMIDDQLDIAEPLIDIATGSGPGAGADKVAAFFGHAPDGAKATAQLQILQAGLMLNQPRMEGPQSDADVKLYQAAAGQLGDPTVPRDIKRAAVKTIRQLQEKYREAAGESRSRGNAPAVSQKRPPLSSFAK